MQQKINAQQPGKLRQAFFLSNSLALFGGFAPEINSHFFRNQKL
jgi:hypothetical protein